jgi:taurine dioxygenase
MTLEFVSTSQGPAIEVKGVNHLPLDDADTRQLLRAFRDSAVLVFRDLQLTEASHISLTRLFGELLIHPLEFLRHPEYPEIISLSGSPSSSLAAEDPAADEIVGYSAWHADLTYSQVPSRGGFLRPVVIPPEGGYTAYIDTAEVYEALPEARKQQLRGLKTLHSLVDSRPGVAVDADIDFPKDVKRTDDVEHPLVFRHPYNHRPVLFISPSFSRAIVGLSRESSDQLLGELKEFSTAERFVYVHQWQQGDLVIWDNWQAIHKGFGHKRKYRRVMHRTTLKGDCQLGDYLI